MQLRLKKPFLKNKNKNKTHMHLRKGGGEVCCSVSKFQFPILVMLHDQQAIYYLSRTAYLGDVTNK